jgi:hypothetical protein
MVTSYDLAVFYIYVTLRNKEACWILWNPKPFGCFGDQGYLEVAPIFILCLFIIWLHQVVSEPGFLSLTALINLEARFSSLETRNFFLREKKFQLITIGRSRNKNKAYLDFAVEARPATRSFT